MPDDRRQRTAGAPPFSTTLPILLLRSREAVVERFRPILHAHDLTEQQWRVLRTLSGVAEIEVGPLAKAVFLRGPSLSRILKDMLERGLIARRSGDADLRRGLISITAQGLETIRAIGPTAKRAGEEITALFGAERMARLSELLLDLEAVLTAPADAAQPGRGRP